ncbi:MAG: hypothetical protein ACLFPV_10880 [Spirochaetaceae bacterium]
MSPKVSMAMAMKKWGLIRPSVTVTIQYTLAFTPFRMTRMLVETAGV